MPEQDPKLQMIDALLASPHRRLVEFGRRHVEARESDRISTAAWAPGTTPEE